MKNELLNNNLCTRNNRHDLSFKQFYSCEFLIDEVKTLYHFKIRTIESNSLFALVKENSEILNWVNAGDVLNMKFYHADAKHPSESMDTIIKYIARDKEGRFKGHYLMVFEPLN